MKLKTESKTNRMAFKMRSTNNSLQRSAARSNILLLWCKPTGRQKFGGMSRGTTKTRRGQLTLELCASAADGGRGSSVACHRT
jgi:hypothetical protein